MTTSYSTVIARNNLIFTGATVTNGGTLTFPTTTTTIVGTDTTDTLTNKTFTNSTINDPTNNVAANSLYNGAVWSATLSGGVTPTVGQVLTYTAAGVAQFSTFTGALTGSGTTTDAVTPVVVGTIPVATDTVVNIRTDVVAKRTDTAPAGFGYTQVLQATFVNSAGTVTFAGGSGNFGSQIFSDAAAAGITVTFIIVGTNVTISVTGIAAQTYAFNSYSVVRTV